MAQIPPLHVLTNHVFPLPDGSHAMPEKVWIDPGGEEVHATFTSTTVPGVVAMYVFVPLEIKGADGVEVHMVEKNNFLKVSRRFWSDVLAADPDNAEAKEMIAGLDSVGGGFTIRGAQS